MKAYADELRDAGFNLSEEENDEVAWGYYSFTASNAEGYQVELTCAEAVSAMTITLSEEQGNDSNDPETPSGVNFPPIPFERTTVGYADNYLAYKSTSATVEQVRAYVEILRSSGYTINEDVQDLEIAGSVIYSFSADNADGYRVTAAFTSGYTAITFSFLG